MLDHHVHPLLDRDGHLCLSLSGMENGSTLCLTAHLDALHNILPQEKPILRDIEKARVRFHGLDLLLGLEVEYSPSTQQETALRIAGLPLDYVVNAVHFVGSEDLCKMDYYLPRTRQEAYGAYLAAVFDSFDAPFPYCTLGHITAVSRSHYYPSPALQWREFPDLLDTILLRAVFLGKGLEVDASSLEETGEPMPSLSVLKRYRELGGELLTVGSDAHGVQNAGKGTQQVRQLLKDCGFSYEAVFRGMKPEMRKL